MKTRTIAVCLTTSLVVVAGCLPDSRPPAVNGPLDANKAAQLQSKIRSANSQKYEVPHTYKDQEFMANWELGNSLKKSSQLQIKPPAQWSDKDVYQALDIVLREHRTKPWYSLIDDTVLKLMRQALQDKDKVALGHAPNTPYDVQVKVKQHTSEWFLEVKVQIVDEDRMAFGF